MHLPHSYKPQCPLTAVLHARGCRSTTSQCPLIVLSKPAVRHPGSPGETQRAVRLLARPHIASSSSNLRIAHPSFSRVHAEKSTELHASDVTPLALIFGRSTQPARLLVHCAVCSCHVMSSTTHTHGGPPSPSIACSPWSLRCSPALIAIGRSARPASPRRAEPQSQETQKPYARIIKPHASPLMPSPGGEQATGDRTRWCLREVPTVINYSRCFIPLHRA